MITQKQIARAAGVSRSTVTRALRNDPQVSQAQSERIQAIAAKLGYRNNPLVSALMTQVRAGKVGKYKGMLAYVVYGWSEPDWEKDEEQQAMLQGAVQRAEELGYGVDLYHYKNTDQARLSRLLWSKGINGVLIPVPQYEKTTPLELKWDIFNAVTVGFRFGYQPLHFASSDFFASIWNALQILDKRGYQKPGLIIDLNIDSFAHFRMDGAMASFQINCLKADKRIPSLHLNPDKPKDLISWWNRYRPDVILSNSIFAFHALHETGVSYPRDTGYLLLRRSYEKNEVAYMDRHNDLIGAAGVDIVTARINRNENGLPQCQRGTLVESELVDGRTLIKYPP